MVLNQFCIISNIYLHLKLVFIFKYSILMYVAYISNIIVDFIVKNLDKQFVINCAAGISRSAAVGMAILCIKHFNGNVYNFNKLIEAYNLKGKK